tara:strand:- start:725 stop:1600 length:876 start_codon:yes stop_codon:yes gene_type:complete
MAFKMKGKSMTKGTKAHTDAIKLNRSMDATNRPDGRAGSSAFQFSQPGAGGPGGDDPKTAAAKAQGREVGEMNKSSKFHPDNVGRKRGAESGFKADIAEVTVKDRRLMDQKKWDAGNVKASQAKNNEGKTNLDALIKRRSSQKKGSDEYKTTQNAINAALGNKTKHKTKASSRSAETQEKKANITKEAIKDRAAIVEKSEQKINKKLEKSGKSTIDYKGQKKSMKSDQKESRKKARLDVKDAREQFGRGSDEVKAAKADKKINKQKNKAQRKQARKDDKENKKINPDFYVK